MVERLPGATLLALDLDTGRTHQIRVHLSHLGHPILGDEQYGGRGGPGLRRQTLHASRLVFRQPRTVSLVELDSALPPDLAGVRDRLVGGDEE